MNCVRIMFLFTLVMCVVMRSWSWDLRFDMVNLHDVLVMFLFWFLAGLPGAFGTSSLWFLTMGWWSAFSTFSWVGTGSSARMLWLDESARFWKSVVRLAAFIRVCRYFFSVSWVLTSLRASSKSTNEEEGSGKNKQPDYYSKHYCYSRKWGSS